MILDGVRKRWPWLKHLFADGAYDRTQLMDKAAFRDFTIQVVKRSDAAVGFEVIPRRWVVNVYTMLPVRAFSGHRSSNVGGADGVRN